MGKFGDDSWKTSILTLGKGHLIGFSGMEPLGSWSHPEETLLPTKMTFLCVFCISGFSLFENSVMTLHGADVLKGNDRPLKDRSQRHLVTIASINNAKSHCASMGQVCPGMEGQTAHGTTVQRFVNGET